jgi:hypothetical protein
MRLNRRVLLITLFVMACGLAVFIASLPSREVAAGPSLTFVRVGSVAGTNVSGGSTVQTVVHPDYLRRKFRPDLTATYWLQAPTNKAIALWVTGVEVHTDKGWVSYSEEDRHETVRLSAGVAQEICVEFPDYGEWRAYIRYAPELPWWPSFKAKLHEAYLTRSFANWSGRAWGGGRFGGSITQFSEVVSP